MPAAVNTFEIEAKSTSLAPLRKKLRSLLETSGFEAKVVHNLLLSVDEVVTNVIRHAYGEKAGAAGGNKIYLAVSDFADRVEIRVEDDGPFFDPLKAPPPQLPREKPGGLGIYLVKSFTDEVHYEPREPRGNRLRLVKLKQGKGRNSKP